MHWRSAVGKSLQRDGCQHEGSGAYSTISTKQPADLHGLSNPFDPIEALRHSAAYLRELLNRLVTVASATRQARRPGLKAGDMVVETKLDRLGR